jgi:hypothetical protein
MRIDRYACTHIFIDAYILMFYLYPYIYLYRVRKNTDLSQIPYFPKTVDISKSGQNSPERMNKVQIQRLSSTSRRESPFRLSFTSVDSDISNLSHSISQKKKVDRCIYVYVYTIYVYIYVYFKKMYMYIYMYIHT